MPVVLCEWCQYIAESGGREVDGQLSDVRKHELENHKDELMDQYDVKDWDEFKENYLGLF